MGKGLPPIGGSIIPADVAARKARIEAKRRRRERTSGIEWNLTNIGAALCLMGFFLILFIFLNFLMTARILLVLSIPSVILIVIGYTLIVYDHYNNLRLQKARRKGKVGTEEE